MTKREISESPIARIRRELGLTQNQFGLLSNASPRTISSLEIAGTAHVPRKVLAALEGLGFDGQQIQAEHQQFMDAQRAKLMEKIKAKAGGTD